MKNMQKKGFTLIELLVVIVIIGILATIGVAQFSSYFGKARDAKRKTAVAQARQLILADIAANSATSTSYIKADAGTVVTSLNGFSLAPDNSYQYGYVANAGDFMFYVCSESEPTTAITAGSDTLAVTCTDAGVASVTVPTTTTGAAFEGATDVPVIVAN